MTERWYVAITHPGREGLALRNLGGSTSSPGCAPPIVEPQRWRERYYRTIWPRWVVGNRVRPLASGYVLVFLELDGPAWHDVLDRCGAGSRFIGGEQPDPAPDIDIDRLLEDALSLDGILAPPKEARETPGLEVGDLVRITLNTWSEALGEILWFDGRGARIDVNVFGRSTPAWFPHGVFEKIGEKELARSGLSRNDRVYRGTRRRNSHRQSPQATARAV